MEIQRLAVFVCQGNMPLPSHWHAQAFLLSMPPLMPTSLSSSASTATPTHPSVFNVPPNPSVPTMPSVFNVPLNMAEPTMSPNIAGHTFPTFSSPPGFPVPTFSMTFLSSPFGQSMMPIYIAMESTKLKIPDDWDGTEKTWPRFKM
jgi:hypothetical protein